jgi:hypothetical protein
VSINLLYRCIPKCPQHTVDAGLVARTLSLEPLKDILIHAQRDGCLRGERLQPTPHYPPDDVLKVGLRVLRRRGGTACLEASPVSFGLH